MNAHANGFPWHSSTLLIEIGRCTVAGVWLYQGLWKKILVVDPEHLSIVTSVAWLRQLAPFALFVIGLVEVALAVWVYSRKRPLAAAAWQTALLLAMNAAGLVWAWTSISDPAGMLIHNAALLTLIWMVAERTEVAC